ncbi:MAG: tetratricopeptide repeat protein [Odoribacteraceae bacterium]|jgi:tetratricopeptide (TPR) repeat protein|nr:tetratricopeptide repeat protein [Odoribacteraceae bacterium]
MNVNELQVIGFAKEKRTIDGVIATDRGEDLAGLLEGATGEEVMVVDLERVSPDDLPRLVHEYKQLKRKEKGIYYAARGEAKRWGGFIDPRLFGSDREVVDSPVLVGSKSLFAKAYGGKDLDETPSRAVAYSLLREGAKFRRLETSATWKEGKRGRAAWNYRVKAPARHLLSGGFFRGLIAGKDPRREMTTRFLMLLFGLFALLYMPYASRDHGISGDEYVDHQHAMLVLDYFKTGNKAALDQPKTMLHLYGNIAQVAAAAAAEAIGAEDVYRVRHAICALTGAAGIIFLGLLGLRLGGGACGLLSMILLFLSPRYLGHSMNNLKDIPFAVGYIVSIYYFIRLFDRFPTVKLRHAIGAIAGIALALGTRSGGLLLFPYLLMYGGLFYALRVGWKECLRIGRHWREIENILGVIAIVLVGGYLLSILCWPFALARPFSNVLLSLREFTNLSIGLRTIFEGKQVMSNMLPAHYAPKYLLIAAPLAVVIGWVGYLIRAATRRREFGLNDFFLLFALVFPVFWVIHKNSNLYGGIRHMLFVMPVMAVLAACFWSRLMAGCRPARIVSWATVVALLLLPLRHAARNYPNEYVYFNELAGGLRGAYGDYETDYYYNSLKEAAEWFKANVDYKGRPVTIITNHSANMQHYFRADTNVKVIYGRYYEKFGKDWDYMIYANVYINDYQLKNGLFPVQEGLLHAVEADGLPMSFVGERLSKKDLEAMRLLDAGDYPGAIRVLEEYLTEHPWNEEMWMRLARLYYASRQPENAVRTANEALKRQPQLMDALTVKALNEVELGRLREAHQTVDRMLEQNDASSSAYYMKGLAYSKEYKEREAIEQLNKALRYNPQNDQALVLAGNILSRNGSHAQAIPLFESAVQLKKADETTFLALAECYSRTGKQERYQQFVALLERDGKDRAALAKLKVRDLLLQQKTAEASALMENAPGINEDDPGWLLLLAIRDFQLGRAGESAARLERVLRLTPRDLDALKLQEQLLRARGASL